MAEKVSTLTKMKNPRGLDKGINYKKGNLLGFQEFSDPKQDTTTNIIHSDRSIHREGDYNERWNSYIFKIICEGISGDDGNLYRFFLSRDPNNNLPIEGANAFTYKYTFRMWNDFKSVAHIYPYVDTGVVFIKQSNFDWDNDGQILVVSKYKQGIEVPISNEDNWATSNIPIEPAEANSSLDFQFHKRQG